MRSLQKWSAAGALLLAVSTATAADHTDGSNVKKDPSTDINDLFAWMSADGSKLNLALSVGGVMAPATFSNAALYTFHLTREQKELGQDMAPTASELVCSFADATHAQCWLAQGSSNVVDYFSGDPSPAAGATSTHGYMLIHAGVHSDPFFFYLNGLNQVISFVQQNLMTLLAQSPNAAGCPQLTQNQVQTVVGVLTGQSKGPSGNTFASLNQLVLVVQLDASSIPGNGNFVSVWASTNKAM